MDSASNTPAANPRGAPASARTTPDVRAGCHHSTTTVITVGRAASSKRHRQAANGIGARDRPRDQANTMPSAAERYNPVQRAQTGNCPPFR